MGGAAIIGHEAYSWSKKSEDTWQAGDRAHGIGMRTTSTMEILRIQVQLRPG